MLGICAILIFIISVISLISQSDLLEKIFSCKLAEKLSVLFLLYFFSCFLLKCLRIEKF